MSPSKANFLTIIEVEILLVLLQYIEGLHDAAHTYTHMILPRYLVSILHGVV